MSTTIEAIDEDIDFNLFEGILPPLEPGLHPDLIPFDVAISNERAKQEGEAVFLIWLRKELGIANTDFRPNEQPACSERPELFFPDWPEPDTFSNDSNDHDFDRAWTKATADQAEAKQICDDCPIRLLCLTRDITIWSTGYAGAGPIDTLIEDPESINPLTGKASATIKIVPSEDKVIGGWGWGAREKIWNQFKIRNRAYLRGLQEDASDVPEVERRGMSTIERDSYVREAQEFKVRSW